VLASEGRVAPTVVQVVAAGEFPMEVDVSAGGAWVTQLPAVFGEPVADRSLVAAAGGLVASGLHPDLPARPVGSGLTFLIAPVRDLDTLRGATRKGSLVGELCRMTGSEGLYLFAVTEDGVTARMFDRGEGIGEDPATGSAAGPLGAYLAEHELAGMVGRRVLIRQGEQVGRPSELHVAVSSEAGSWRPRVGGGVHVVGRGEFTL
jgi:PhzF family phenazine biosynthesis protein